MAIGIDPQLDRRRAHLSAPARVALLEDNRRIVVVGARGWIGRTLLMLLRDGLGDSEFDRRVTCIGSTEGQVELEHGVSVVQHEIAWLMKMSSEPTFLFHLAFLTKEKVSGMEPSAYVSANRKLSETIQQALGVIGADRLFVASSGAAAFAKDTDAEFDLRLYGQLKLEDEERFANWALGEPGGRRAIIGRIYSVSGPWMNKYETYALASFILNGIAGRQIEVRAPFEVFRSYVAVRELLSFAVLACLSPSGDPAFLFSTGGQAVELIEVANIAARLLDVKVHRQPISSSRQNRYIGDADGWNKLLARFGMTHLPLEEQVAETATWLARQNPQYIPRQTS